MVRKKPQPVKQQQQKQQLPPSTKNASSTVNKDLPLSPEEMRLAQQRYMFNIDEIEKRYYQSTSGMVINLNPLKFEFDPELCTERDDKKLIEMVKRQKRILKPLSGGTLLSTLIPDPDEKDKQKIKRGKTLNKLFEEYHKKREQDEKILRRRCTDVVKYTSKPVTTVNWQQQQDPLKDIDCSNFKVNLGGIDFGGMVGRYFRFGGGLPLSDLSKIIESNRHIPIHVPETLKRQLSAIKQRKDDGKENNDYCGSIVKMPMQNWQSGGGFFGLEQSPEQSQLLSISMSTSKELLSTSASTSTGCTTSACTKLAKCAPQNLLLDSQKRSSVRRSSRLLPYLVEVPETPLETIRQRALKRELQVEVGNVPATINDDNELIVETPEPEMKQQPKRKKSKKR